MAEPDTEVQPPARPIASLSISHALRAKLVDAGYSTTAEIAIIAAEDLCAELGIKLEEAFDLVRQCIDPPGPSRPASPSRTAHATQHTQSSQIQSTTAASLLSTASLPRFSTCIDALDDLLADFSPSSSANGTSTTSNGASSNEHGKGKGRMTGITTGQSVQIAGPPGIGKTTITVAMALEARLEVCQRARRREEKERARREKRERSRSRGRSASRGRGLREDASDKAEENHESSREGVQEGQVLIIDTEGGIPPDKLYRYAELITKEAGGTSPSNILDGIHLVRVATQVQMVAFLNLLDEWLGDHPHVNLVIIDSLSFHFRQPSMDLSARRRIMDISAKPQRYINAPPQLIIQVIVTSQMATKLLSAEGKRVNFDTGEKAVLMPQLGEVWQTAKTIRIALFRGQPGDELRYAHVDSASDAEGRGWAKFDIDADGLPVDVGTFSPRR